MKDLEKIEKTWEEIEQSLSTKENAVAVVTVDENHILVQADLEIIKFTNKGADEDDFNFVKGLFKMNYRQFNKERNIINDYSQRVNSILTGDFQGDYLSDVEIEELSGIYGILSQPFGSIYGKAAKILADKILKYITVSELQLPNTLVSVVKKELNSFALLIYLNFDIFLDKIEDYYFGFQK